MDLDPQQAAHIYREAEKRRRLRSAIVDAARAIPKQLAAILDTAHLVAFFCTRRSGKTYAIGLKLFLTCLEHPGCSCLYMGLTADAAVATLNKDILEVINKRFGLGATFREKDHRWELPNGSLIYIRGADANVHEMAKILGQKYRLAVLDEVAKYRGNVEKMVYGDLLPAMGDDVGQVVLSGVPSDFCSGLFYEVTTNRKPGWSVHVWTWQDNVHKRDNIRQIHDAIVKANPLVVKTASYRQEWLGEWVVSEGALVYKYDAARNTIASLPELPRATLGDRYHFLLGVDLGFVDPTALVVGAYSEHDPVLYIVHAEKYEGVIIDAVAKLIKALWNDPSRGHFGPYPFERMIVDGAALQSVEEMRQRHGIPLVCAEKRDKRATIEVLNSDLVTERIKVLPAAAKLVEEWTALIWDERKLAAVPKKWEEDPRKANHASDAMLYMWRAARNYDATTPAEPEGDPRLAPDFAERHLFEQMAARNRQSVTRGWPGNIAVDRVPRQTVRFGRG